MARPVHLVCATDDGYAMPTAVMVASAVDRSSAPLVVHVLDGGLSSAAAARLRRALDRTTAEADARVVWHEPDPGGLDGLSGAGHITATAYLRLLAPDLLAVTDPDARRAVWIDGDAVVTGDLAQVARVDLQGDPVGAVRNGAATFARMVREPSRRTGRPIDPDAPYFNSGVLVMDLAAWRAERIGTAVLDDLHSNGPLYRFVDQCGLNAVLAGRWASLDDRWNVQVGHSLTQRAPPAVADVRILHFTGRGKPWLPVYPTGGRTIGAYRATWLRAARASGWFLRNDWARFRAGLAAERARNRAARVLGRARSSTLGRLVRRAPSAP